MVRLTDLCACGLAFDPKFVTFLFSVKTLDSLGSPKSIDFVGLGYQYVPRPLRVRVPILLLLGFLFPFWFSATTLDSSRVAMFGFSPGVVSKSVHCTIPSVGGCMFASCFRSRVAVSDAFLDQLYSEKRPFSHVSLGIPKKSVPPNPHKSAGFIESPKISSTQCYQKTSVI